jgi:hypothetical protein
MDTFKKNQEHRREAETDTHKPPYEKPVIMSLGEFARGWGGGMGQCSPGSDARGTCSTGPTANGTCGGGSTANGTCSPAGSTAANS